MANVTITATADGNWSNTATWDLGVVPNNGADNYNVVINPGVDVTLDQNATIGWDTGSRTGVTTSTEMAIDLKGRLVASRSGNYTLTCRGHIRFFNQTNATGTPEIDFGTDASPIPAGNSITVVFASATPSDSKKYGVVSATRNMKLFAQGKPRKRNTYLTSAAAAAATAITVADATGWEVGDRIVLAPADFGTNSTARYTRYDDVLLHASTAPVDNGNGTWTVTLAAGLTYAHAASCIVGNFTSNVTFQGDSTYCSIFQIYGAYSQTHIDDAVDIKDVAWRYLDAGGNPAAQMFSETLPSGSTNPTIKRVSSCAFYRGYTNRYITGGTFLNLGRMTRKSVLEDWAIFNPGQNGGVGRGVSWDRCGPIVVDREHCYHTVFDTHALFTCQRITYNDPEIWGFGAVSAGGAGAFNLGACGLQVNRGRILTSGDASFSHIISTPAAGGVFDVTFDQTKIMDDDIADGFVKNLIYTSNMTGRITFSNCLFGTQGAEYTNIFGTNGVGDTQSDAASLTVFFDGINGDPAQMYIRNAGMTASRATGVTGPGGDTVIALRCTATAVGDAYPLELQFLVPAPAGETVSVNVWGRKVSGYAGSVNPAITFGGLGETDQTAEITASAGTWQLHTLTLTNNQSSDGFFILTLTNYGQSGDQTEWAQITAPLPAAFDAGAFSYWGRGQPAPIIVANFVSAGDVWDHEDFADGGYSKQELMRLFASALLGKASGLDAQRPKYRGLADTKDRIDATTDTFGNRTAVTLDAS